MNAGQVAGFLGLSIVNVIVMFIGLIWVFGLFVTTPTGLYLGWAKARSLRTKLVAGTFGALAGFLIARLMGFIAIFSSSMLLTAMREAKPSTSAPPIPTELALWPLGQLDVSDLEDWALLLGLIGGTISVAALVVLLIAIGKATGHWPSKVSSIPLAK